MATVENALIEDREAALDSDLVVVAPRKGLPAKVAEDKHAGPEDLQAQLENAKEELATLERGLTAKLRSVDQYVHDKPWQSMGIAAGVGMAAGVGLTTGAFYWLRKKKG